MDNFYKSHFPLFDFMFKKYGLNYMKPGDMKPFMMADEFESLIATARLLGDELTTRDCSVCFSTSIMT